jgi:hypothetical protein
MSVFGKIQQFVARNSGEFKNVSTVDPPKEPAFNDELVLYPYAGVTGQVTVDELIDSGEPQAQLLAYLILDGRASAHSNGVRCDWPSIYDICEDPEYSDAQQLLRIPESGQVRLVLREMGTLADPGFRVVCNEFRSESGRTSPLRGSCPIQLCDGSPTLISRSSFELLQKIRASEDLWGSQASNERAWGALRPYAIAANASLSPILQATIVVVPNSLRIDYSKVDFGDVPVVEVKPSFEGAPEEWARAFNSLQSVPVHIDLPAATGRTRVIFTEEVRSVLNTIKKDFPGNRVAGVRAQAFLRNPFASLGEASSSVLEEEHIELQRQRIGIGQKSLSLHPDISNGQIIHITAQVTTTHDDGQPHSKIERIETAKELKDLVVNIDKELRQGSQYFKWRQYLIDLDGDSGFLAERAERWMTVWESQSESTISLEDIYELAQYNSRVEGIGVAKPIYSAFLKKEGGDETPWLPDNVTPYLGVQLTAETPPVFIPLSAKWLERFGSAVEAAKASGKSTVIDQDLPVPISVAEAEDLVSEMRRVIGGMDGSQPTIKVGPVVPIDGGGQKPREAKARETLLIKANIKDLNYSETDAAKNRAEILAVPEGFTAELPSELKPEFLLKDHQMSNLAWMQFLLDRGSSHCRGLLLADDMGLGKTLQLLSFLSWAYQTGRTNKPSLIVVPVALLKNWVNETKKFFHSFPEVLVLHGRTLGERKQPKELIDRDLLEKKISNLLVKGWMGTAKVVITTYETVRDYEFSFAKEDFFVMICDEAQKIKSPNALVTTACKKQKSDFRIACTGTPVENTLADLWCLFDYIQPGLLGALDTFGKSYRRPIEVKRSGDKNAEEALNQLRATIDPQVRRKMKHQIAKDLPEKIIVGNSSYVHLDKERRKLAIPISSRQRQMYADGINKIREASNLNDSHERARVTFGVLNFIRKVCADPYSIATQGVSQEALGSPEHLKDSPKTAWLVDLLKSIASKKGKAILFTDVKDIQKNLVTVIRRHFSITPSVINGDTDQRQDVIDRFQGVEGFNVLILSPLAAGFGVNIVAANHVIHYTRTWNPAKEGQATDRAYRIGQDKDVYVYCPTIDGGDFVSFEQKLDMLMSEKSDLAGDMLDGIGEDISAVSLMPTDGPMGAARIPERFIDLTIVDALDGHSFEHFCQILFTTKGFNAMVTLKNPGDGGVDIVAIKGTDGILVQCKHSVSEAIGWDAVKEIYAGAEAYRARYPGMAFKLVAITNREFNGTACEQAKLLNVQLLERKALSEELDRLQVPVSVLDEYLLRLGIPQ